MKLFKKLGLSLSIIVLSFTSSTLSALAVVAPTAVSNSKPGTGQALEIAPPLLYLTANPGQTIDAKIFIRNIASEPLLVSEQTNDFVAQGEDGTPKILLKGSINDPYSLKNYVSPIGDLLLQPQQIRTITVPISVPANASPGGHYGVLRFTGTPPALNGTNGVALSASLGSLVLLTVSGHIVQKLAVTSFTSGQNGHLGSFFQNLPVNFTETIKNQGNVHVEPTGLLSVTDMFGKKLVNLRVNSDAGNILPDSSRQFSEQLIAQNVNSHHLFGRYSAVFSLTYGSPSQTLNGKLTFWVFPITEIVIAIVVLIGGFFVLRWAIRRYNQRILSRAQTYQPKSKPSSKKTKK